MSLSLQGKRLAVAVTDDKMQTLRQTLALSYGHELQFPGAWGLCWLAQFLVEFINVLIFDVVLNK